ncbi:MAG: class I SAM-dependent methyltransferase [Bacteroidetes bacterium]|nr:MAG: class I SAM-dependent methyltransferase [Bacteroidota bacterium]
MNREKETFETWNKIAGLYQEKFMDLNLYNDTYDFICDSIIEDNPKILEIGCGPGNITRYLLSKRPDFDIFGIDFAPNMIQLAEANNPTARFATMDCRRISELKANYNAIICGFCLPFLTPEESVKLITDSYNLLYNNGLIYLSFVEGDPKESDYKTGSSGDRVYFHYYVLDELTKHLSVNKFEEIKTFKVRFYKSETEFDIHTILIARKNNIA